MADALLASEEFREQAREIRATDSSEDPGPDRGWRWADDDDDEQAELAAHFARAYVLRGPTARRAIARLLLVAASEQDRRRVYYLMASCGLRAFFCDAEEPGDRRHPLRPGTAPLLEDAARLVAQRGARRCLECGTKFAGQDRRDCCFPCGDHQRGHHAEAIRTLLDLAAPAILGQPAERATARRLRRR